MKREQITDALDALGLLGVAAGVGAGVSMWIGWWGAAVGGALLIAGTQLATWVEGRR